MIEDAKEEAKTQATQIMTQAQACEMIRLTGS